FFFSSRRRHTRLVSDWSSDVCSSDLASRMTAPVVCCVIPCYNVAALCGEVVREAAQYADHVVAINDGSTDATAQVLSSVAAASRSEERRVGKECRSRGWPDH